MSLVINTNVSSLTAQRAIADSKNDLSTAMERLSTGSKINSASDDAAGLAMSQRMTAQIHGLNMAIKNSNDGIAMTKSIEGAIAEVSDMLQRMRELSIQAANGTNSASDRTYLQDEVNLLIQEITRVSANTRYNGSLILDGTFINKQLQVGIEEGEHITFSVDSIAAKQIGAHTLVGNGVNPEDPAAAPPNNPVTTAEDIAIFGYLGTKTVESSSQDTSKEVAEKVNLLTAETGVKAYAKTYAALSSGDGTARTYNIKINGFQTGNFIISSTDVGDAVDAVNRISGSSGVTAKVENNKVILFDADGDDITIENTKTGTDFVDLVLEKLGEDGLVSNVIGDKVRLGEGATSANTNAIFTQAHGTLSQYASQVHTLTDGTTTLSITAGASPTTASLVALFQADANYSEFNYTIAANGSNAFTYTAKTSGAVQAADHPVLSAHANVTTEGALHSAAAVAEVSTTANLITAIAGGTAADAYVIDFAGTTLTFALEDTGNTAGKISGSGSNSPTAATIVADIQNHSGYAGGNFTVAAGTGTGEVVFTAKTAGVGSPATTKHAGNAAVTAAQTTAGTAAGNAGASADATRISGTLKFVSSNSFSVEQAGNANGNLAYFAAGSQTASLVDLTQVKISTESGASDAISVIDAALDKVAQMRSDLGAIENRMEHTISNLMNIAEKTADSRSRLEDADFALESAQLAKNQVLQQAGTSMLAQANQMSQLVMELLRG